MLSIYNTLNNKKEIFKSIEPSKVKMYVCGMTVYDFCHIGHARVLIVFDMITRWLRESGYEVTYVRNITDIDDKIIKKAIVDNVNYKVVTENFIKEMDHDAASTIFASPFFKGLQHTSVKNSFVKIYERIVSEEAAFCKILSDFPRLF